MYRRLLREHGLLVPRCDNEGATGRRCCLPANHTELHNYEPRDVFGHPVKRPPIHDRR